MKQNYKTYNKIFLPYKPIADVNYIFLFYLYGIAERYEDNGVKADIWLPSIAGLTRCINDKYSKYRKSPISQTTVGRILVDKEYEDFFSVKSFACSKWILLKNEFNNIPKEEQIYHPFVVLDKKVYTFLIEQNDNLLAKYVIYCKYQCGYYHGKSDFTANQFLQAFGYSIKSNSTRDKLSYYNKLLEEEKIIKIDRHTAENGTRRNTYTFIAGM